MPPCGTQRITIIPTKPSTARTSETMLKQGQPTAHTPDSPISEKRTEEYYKKRPCAELCGIAAEIFQTWLDNQ